MNHTATTVEIGTTKTGTKTHLMYQNRPSCSIDGGWNTGRANITKSMTVQISELADTVEGMDVCNKCVRSINRIIKNHA
jgi:hypothetical protein